VTELFDRVAVLQVDTVVIRDLHFTFKIKRTLRSTPNEAEIHVFNLNENHRNQLAALPSVPCRLSVGYQGAEHVIFAGQLRNCASSYAGASATWDTKFDGVDGANALRTARVQRSYRPGVKLETLFADLADSLGLGRGNALEVARAANLTGAGNELVRGTVLTGGAADELEQLCRSCELEFSIQNGTLQLLPLREALAGEVLLVQRDAGLVNDVTKDARGNIAFKMLMTPDLFPGRRVQPNTRTVRGGNYRVTKTEHSGDTHGQDWYVTCAAEPEGRAR
jgi:hypothetical protein